MTVLSWLEEHTWESMVDQDNALRDCYIDQKETIVAFESSVRYTTDTGYLTPDEARQQHLDKYAAFSRSSS
ncbi:hypothetical protein N7517_007562 [Penicillium concentricum]|uniref:Uncharacterized protein n=1 Tax=Penicillium concentricum TaxID=293559 RepID=A0A9W9SBG0_9EURO|nr:uncharacterized protein N7517_007562 [Penicillium concentricum]KAJ5375556.1 hypothetical protein N7517_007562 [Penicillium concentricum]